MIILWIVCIAILIFAIATVPKWNLTWREKHLPPKYGPACYSKPVEEIKQDIAKTLKEHLDKQFLGKWITGKPLEEHISFQIVRFLSETKRVRKEDLHFHITEKDRNITIIPEDLYTGLLLQGIWVPREVISSRDEWTTDNGTYCFKHGMFCLKPNFPVNYITIDFKMDKDGNLIP